jgi:hypothetical protein
MSDLSDTSTEKIAVVIIIIGLALLLPCMYVRYRQKKRAVPVFGHYRSISRNIYHARRQSAPSRLEQVVVVDIVETDANSTHNSILPRYDIDKAPPAYGEAPPYIETDTDPSRRYSIDITDMHRPSDISALGNATHSN